MWNDLKEAIRSLSTDRMVTLVVVATLALAIGVNTTIFSALNGILFKPLPFAEPGRLVTLFESNRELSIDRSRVSAATFMDWRDGSRRLSGLAAWRYLGHTLTDVGEPERVGSLEVSPALFRVLGIPPEIGRTFTDAEEQPGNEHLAILSWASWQRRFGGDPLIIDRSIRLDGEPYVVVGVMPASFRFPADDPDVEVWSPLTLDLDALLTRPHRMYEAIGRIAPDATLEQAAAELDAIANRIASDYPDSNAGWGVSLVPTHVELVGDTGTTLWFLFAAVTFVLLIGCANIANLLLARSTKRSRGYAIRAAFGASRWMLLRHALAESLVMAGVGGVAGLLVAWAGVRGLSALLPTNIPRADAIGIDLTVLLFTAGVAVAAGLLSGLAPALRLMRPAVASVLKDAGRGAVMGRRGRWLASTLVTVEVALALVLLSSAGLMMRSFGRLLDVDPGFRTDGIVSVQVALPAARYPQGAQQRQFFEALMQRIRMLRDVEQAGAVSVLPLSPLGVQFELPFTVAGMEAALPSERPRGDYRAVMPGYFETMGIPVLQGRTFDEFDGGDGRRVAIINQTLARRYFADADPVGRFVNMPMAGDLEIVGIVGDVLQDGPGSEPRPEVFAPYSQLPLSEMHFVIGTDAAPGAITTVVKEEMRRLDPELAVAQVSTIQALLSRNFSEPRFNAALLGGLAVTALLLAIVGIYGVVSYSVAQRTAEIGVRMALGAGRGDTIVMILREVLAVLGLGVLLGLAGALAGARLIEGFLFDVTPRDPVTHAVVATTLVLAGVLAALLPAARAARVDPLVALRID